MRFRVHLQWLVLTVLFTIFLSGSLLLRKSKIESKTTLPTPERGTSLAPSRKVTKSLAELGKMDEVNKHFLFLNDVPKCGSEIFILILQKLQGFNNFKHIRLKGGNKRYLTNLQQEYLVYDIYDDIKTEAVPLSFDRHVYFINFTQFDKQFPTYINLIRHPVEKVISRMSLKDRQIKQDYYYKCLISKKNNCNFKNGQPYDLSIPYFCGHDPRCIMSLKDRQIKQDYYYKCLISKKNNCNFKNGQPYDLSIPYFCGHDPRCMVLNDIWALQKAKNNVVRYFPVVGVLEELNATLEILENKIPYYFKGAQKIYEKDLLSVQKKDKKLKAPTIIRRKLEESLIDELDFYNWIKARLFKQLKIIYGEHNFH